MYVCMGGSGVEVWKKWKTGLTRSDDKLLGIDNDQGSEGASDYDDQLSNTTLVMIEVVVVFIS